MASIGSTEQIIPPDDPKESPATLERVVIVIHPSTQPECPVPARRTAPREDSRQPEQPSKQRPEQPTDRPRGGRHRRDEQSWLHLADDVVRSWPLTLRVVVLILAIATGSTAVVMALGVVGQLALAGLAARGREERRRRLRAFRTAEDLPTK